MLLGFGDPSDSKSAGSWYGGATSAATALANASPFASAFRVPAASLAPSLYLLPPPAPTATPAPPAPATDAAAAAAYGASVGAAVSAPRHHLWIALGLAAAGVGVILLTRRG